MLRSFRLVPEGNASKKISESLRLEFSKTISAKNFALLDAGNINSGPLYRGVTTLLFYLYKQVWQVQEPFCNSY